MKQQIQLSFVSVLCDPAVRVLDLSGSSSLHWSVVSRLCQQLPDMNNVTRINLGSWSCRKYGLMSLSNQEDGYSLMFLPHLTHLAVTDVSHKFMASLALYCPNIVSLKVCYN